jgi:hypothetical protein
MSLRLSIHFSIRWVVIVSQNLSDRDLRRYSTITAAYGDLLYFAPWLGMGEFCRAGLHER